MNLSGFVLVGGKSSRMRASKAALRFGDKTFAENAVQILRASAARPVFLVVNQQQRAAREFGDEQNLLTDIFPARGALGAIYTALHFARTEWAAILAVDLPFVAPELFVRLTEFACGATAVIAPMQPDKTIQPLCALYRVAPCRAAIANLIGDREKTAPARCLLGAIETRVVEFAEIADLPGSESFFANVNTPEDYERALKLRKAQ